MHKGFDLQSALMNFNSSNGVTDIVHKMFAKRHRQEEGFFFSYREVLIIKTRIFYQAPLNSKSLNKELKYSKMK